MSPASITHLIARIQELEEKNLQLREALTPSVQLPAGWRLTPQQTVVLLTLHASPVVVRFESLALAAARGSDPITDDHVAVLVSKIRRRLKERGIGVRIISRRGVGYGLDDLSRAVITKALDGGKQQVAA